MLSDLKKHLNEIQNWPRESERFFYVIIEPTAWVKHFSNYHWVITKRKNNGEEKSEEMMLDSFYTVFNSFHKLWEGSLTF